jgi:hypothetical protein
LKIFKCACTSIVSYLAGLKTQSIVGSLWSDDVAKNSFDLVTFDENALNDYLTFTFVRNPYDRFLSFYRNWIVNPPHEEIFAHYRDQGLRINMQFDECVRAFTQIPDVSFLEGHTAPQYLFVFRGDTLRVKFVGKVENLPIEFEFIKQACHLQGDLRHANYTSTRTEPDPYTPELRGLIYTYYRRDFEIFGYNPLDAWR